MTETTKQAAKEIGGKGLPPSVTASVCATAGSVAGTAPSIGRKQMNNGDEKIIKA